MFMPFGTISLESLTGRKLWFAARFVGIGKILRDGTEWVGPMFSVDTDIFMLITGAGSGPNSCFCEFIQLIDEVPEPVVIDQAELILRSAPGGENDEQTAIPFGAWERV